MSDEMFPILESGRYRVPRSYPRAVPWDVVAAHEKQAWHNHSQSLKRLADRGGLGWSELELVLLDQAWDGLAFSLPRDEAAYISHETAAADRVMKYLADHTAVTATESKTNG